jgi:hypothetical protein
MISPRHLSRGVNVLQQSDTLNMSTHLSNFLQDPLYGTARMENYLQVCREKRLNVFMITLESIYSNLRCTQINLN